MDNTLCCDETMTWSYAPSFEHQSRNRHGPTGSGQQVAFECWHHPNMIYNETSSTHREWIACGKIATLVATQYQLLSPNSPVPSGITERAQVTLRALSAEVF